MSGDTDRERIVRVETTLAALEKRADERHDVVMQSFDDLKSLLGHKVDDIESAVTSRFAAVEDRQEKAEGRFWYVIGALLASGGLGGGVGALVQALTGG